MSDNPDRPLVLTVPGLDNSGPDHWQSLWEQRHAGCFRVQLGQWDKPHRNSWVNQLNLAMRAVEGPVLLAAHSLGCHAVAAWAQMDPDAASLVAGALLVAPPEVDFFPLDVRVAAFSPTASAVDSFGGFAFPCHSRGQSQRPLLRPTRRQSASPHVGRALCRCRRAGPYQC